MVTGYFMNALVAMTSTGRIREGNMGINTESEFKTWQRHFFEYLRAANIDALSEYLEDFIRTPSLKPMPKIKLPTGENDDTIAN